MSESPDTSLIAPKRRTSRGIILLILLLLAAQAATSAYLFWLHTKLEIMTNQEIPTAGTTDNDRLQALESVLSRMDAELTALSADMNMHDAPALHEAVAALQQEVRNLQDNSLSDERIATMLSVAKRIEEINARVEKDQQSKWQQIQLLGALDALERAVQSGERYDTAYRALYQAAGDNQSLLSPLRMMESHSVDGVPTLSQLQSRFVDAIDAYMQAQQSATDSHWSAIRNNLSSLVTIRKVGADHSGNDAQSRIARAEAVLTQGKVARARDEISALPDADARAFSTWLSMAEAHLQAQEALRMIREHALAPLKE